MVTTVSAQATGVVMTHARVPSRETLDRLGLRVGWTSRIKLTGRPDSLRTVQLIPSGSDLQIAIQSQQGDVFILDAQNGDFLWSTPVGSPYWPGEDLAYNAQNIFVTRKNLLFVLDRRNGRQRLYDVDGRGGRIDFGIALPSVPSAAPTAGEKVLYVPIGDRVAAYEIPAFEAAELFTKEEYGGLFKVNSLRMGQIFSSRYSETYFSQAPLLTESVAAFVTSRGMMGFNRFKGDWLYEFVATGDVVAAPGQNATIAYVPSSDFTLYAINMRLGRLLWRYLSPGPITKSPIVTDNNIFVFNDRKGMAMLNRADGTEIWRNKEADSYLAMSDRFVYAADRHGKLLILDIRKGTALGQLDLGDWRVRLANEYSDRIFLANHDGQFLCLFPRGSVTPMNIKSRIVEEMEPVKKDGKEKEKKDDEKKEDEKKDDEKKEDKKKDDKIGRLLTPFNPPVALAAFRIEAWQMNDRIRQLTQRIVRRI